MNGVNLIPAARREARKLRARVRAWGVGLSVYAAALAIGYAVMAATWGGTRTHWQGRITALESQLERDNGALQERQRELTEKLAARQANAVVGEQPDWSMLLGLIARTVRDDVVLESTSLRPAEPSGKPAKPVTLALSGLGRTHEAVSDFVLRLEATKVFSRVALLETRRTATARAEAVSFRVEAALSEGP